MNGVLRHPWTVITSAMEKGKGKRAILGDFSKVTSPGSDKDAIRTCFLGHILRCSGNITITVPLSQVLCVFIIYSRSGEMGKACPSPVCRRKRRVSATCCSFTCLAVTAQARHQLTNAGGGGWVQGGFPLALLSPRQCFRVVGAGSSNLEMSCPSRGRADLPPSPGNGAWPTLSQAGNTPPISLHPSAG